jgi:hypothetical protein
LGHLLHAELRERRNDVGRDHTEHKREEHANPLEEHSQCGFERKGFHATFTPGVDLSEMVFMAVSSQS